VGCSVFTLTAPLCRENTVELAELLLYDDV
jgi:hypothetical protein